MLLSNGENTISEARYQAAREDMLERQSDEYETVHNGSGRSEEMPSQLAARHRLEDQQLQADWKSMSIAEWLHHYPDTGHTHFLTAHAKIDDEIIHGLADARRLRALERPGGEEQTEAVHLTRDEMRSTETQLKHQQDQRDTPEQALADQRTIQRFFNGDQTLSRQEVDAAIIRENARDSRLTNHRDDRESTTSQEQEQTQTHRRRLSFRM